MDFPTPGSPPIRQIPPGTSPPPTRSSKPSMPVRIRGQCSDSMAERVWQTAALEPPGEKPVYPGPSPSGASSSMVFHSPHSEHWPFHFGKTAPHPEQANRGPFFLAIPTGRPSEHRPRLLAFLSPPKHVFDPAPFSAARSVGRRDTSRSENPGSKPPVPESLRR